MGPVTEKYIVDKRAFEDPLERELTRLDTKINRSYYMTIMIVIVLSMGLMLAYKMAFANQDMGIEGAKVTLRMALIQQEIANNTIALTNATYQHEQRITAIEEYLENVSIAFEIFDNMSKNETIYYTP